MTLEAHPYLCMLCNSVCHIILFDCFDSVLTVCPVGEGVEVRKGGQGGCSVFSVGRGRRGREGKDGGVFCMFSGEGWARGFCVFNIHVCVFLMF